MSTEQTLLLVDDEQNILSSLKRLLRRDGYRIFTATSGEDGLGILEEHEVGVVISDQRMPSMSGVEFLSAVKKRFPDTIRIMLSGYTELNSVTDSINKGEIYKFLTKPWDDELLRANVREAFEQYMLSRENEHLAEALQTVNARLSEENITLERSVEEKSREAVLNRRVLHFAQEVLQYLPVAVLGIDGDGVVAYANGMANELFSQDNVTILGCHVHEILPDDLSDMLGQCGSGQPPSSAEMVLNGKDKVIVNCSVLSTAEAQGKILVLTRKR